MLFDYLFGKKECLHSKIPLEVECGYCPDCGELVENQWFILRCSCCGVKIPAMLRDGKIVPIDKHCINCGMAEFNVERLEKVNFINVHYAVLLKKTIQSESYDFVQSWVDVSSSGTFCGKLGLLK